MAREAGFIVGEPWREMLIKRFADLVRADEREACAKVCDAMYAEYPEENQDYAFALAAQQLAAAIRARGNT
jgi:DNA-binding cell septation regulator SpoVG